MIWYTMTFMWWYCLFVYWQVLETVDEKQSVHQYLMEVQNLKERTARKKFKKLNIASFRRLSTMTLAEVRSPLWKGQIASRADRLRGRAALASATPWWGFACGYTSPCCPLGWKKTWGVSSMVSSIRQTHRPGRSDRTPSPGPNTLELKRNRNC